MEAHVRPAEHAQKGMLREKFRLELAVKLLGTFSSRKHPGHPRSDEHARQTRLNHGLDHYPRSVAKAKRCVVSEGIRRRKKLPECDYNMNQEPCVPGPPVWSTYVQMMSIGVLRSVTSSSITVTNCLFLPI